ncbi:hypothetical protein [Cohnella cholangitidis]|uniref:Lipoprotein n=1 Tax=Cohnella cholangitidis TaxID=2598458 RepID=A0A7G5BSU9_9BACL|nr:hypothetical protein [Cohnella cholangitidis]QMV40033.1 hypothetical protein FPL14_01565 [Cohnella cholangitidis]
MIRVIAIFVIISLLIVGCGSSVSTFEGTVEAYHDDRLLVNCSDEVNKGKKNIDDVGYICSVQVTDKTNVTDEAGNPLEIEQLPQSAFVKVTLVKARNIKDSESRRSKLEAKEIVLMNQ